MTCGKIAVHQEIVKYQTKTPMLIGKKRFATARKDNLMRRMDMKSLSNLVKKIKAKLLRKSS